MANYSSINGGDAYAPPPPSDYSEERYSSQEPNFSSESGNSLYVPPPVQSARRSGSRGSSGGSVSSQEPNFSSEGAAAVYVPPPVVKTEIVKAEPPKSQYRQVPGGVEERTPLTDIQNEPFFSFQGQKARARNVGAVFGNIFDLKKETGVTAVVGAEGSKTRAVASALVPQNPVDVLLTALPFAAGKGVKAVKAGYSASRASRAARAVGAASAAARESRVVSGLAQASERARELVGGSRVARAVAKGSQVLKSTPPGRVLGAARSSFIGRNVEGILRVGAAGEAFALGGQAVTRATRPDLAVSNEVFEQGFRDVLQQNLEPKEATRGAGAIIKRAAAGLSIFVGNKQEFEQLARKRFAQEGLSGPELDAAVAESLRTRKNVGVAEAGALLNIARASEAFGRRGVLASFESASSQAAPVTRKVAGRAVAKKVFVPIAFAGVAEGGATVAVQEQQRLGKVKPADVALGAAVGGVSAGVLGSLIAGTRINKPGTSKAVEIGTYLLDPFEKPGDILQDITEAGVSSFTGVPRRVPVISASLSPSSPVSFGVSTPSQSSNGRAPAGSRGGRRAPSSPLSFGSPVPVPAQTPAPVPSPANTPVNVPSRPLTPTLDAIVGTPPVSPQIPVPVPPDVVVPVPPEIPTPISPDTSVPVPVPVNVPINVNVPSNTPILRVPPPLPFVLPVSSALGGSRPVKGRRYVDEVSAAGALLGQIGGAVPVVVPRPTGKRGKAAKQYNRDLAASLGQFVPPSKSKKSAGSRGKDVFARIVGG